MPNKHPFIYYKCYFYWREKAWLFSYSGAPRGNNYHLFTISSFPLKLKRICNMSLRHMDKPSQPSDSKRWFFFSTKTLWTSASLSIQSARRAGQGHSCLDILFFLEAAATRQWHYPISLCDNLNFYRDIIFVQDQRNYLQAKANSR